MPTEEIKHGGKQTSLGQQHCDTCIGGKPGGLDLGRGSPSTPSRLSLTNFDVIAQVAAEENYIAPEDVQRLIAFRNNPSDESWIGGRA